jgi:hypothetical protein
MRYLCLIGLMLSLGAVADSYPVDLEIGKLRAKADYLETLKAFLLSNQSQVQYGSNQVALTAGALRSETLVMAIGPKFPGQYAGFHQAPKPQMLEQVVAASRGRGDLGQGAVVVTAGLDVSPGSTKLDTFVVKIAEPAEVKDAGGLWWYNQRSLRTSLPQSGEHVEASGVSSSKQSISVSCN